MADRNDVFDRAADWLTRTLYNRAAREVVYVRGTQRTTWRATIGRTEFEVDEGGILVRTESRDYIGQADKLVLDGVKVTPQRGDRIEELVGSTTHIYEVMPFDVTDDCYRYADRYRNQLRIYTKHVDTLD